jgi:16S rRNA C967 or C1407 C5-methylase (RsmB/RsmF family)
LVKKRDLSGINNNAHLQKKLLKKASDLMKNSSLLIYSTCSIEVEENELNSIYAIEKLNLTNIYLPLKFPFETLPENIIKEKKLLNKIMMKKLKSYRFIPYISKTQGFYICLFEKKY